MLRLLFGSAAVAAFDGNWNVMKRSRTYPVKHGELVRRLKKGTYSDDAPNDKNKLRNALKCDSGFMPKDNLKLKLDFFKKKYRLRYQTIWSVETNGKFRTLKKNKKGLCVKKCAELSTSSAVIKEAENGRKYVMKFQLAKQMVKCEPNFELKKDLEHVECVGNQFVMKLQDQDLQYVTEQASPCESTTTTTTKPAAGPARLVWFHDAGIADCRPESEEHHVAFCINEERTFTLVQWPNASGYNTYTFADTDSARTGHAKGEKATLCTAAQLKMMPTSYFESRAHIWTSTKCDPEKKNESVHDVVVQDEGVMDWERQYKQVNLSSASTKSSRRLEGARNPTLDPKCLHVFELQTVECIIKGSKNQESGNEMTFEQAEEWCRKKGGRLPTSREEATGNNDSWINASCTGTCEGKKGGRLGHRVPYGTEALCEKNGKPTGYQCRFRYGFTQWYKRTSRGTFSSKYFNEWYESTQNSCELL